MPLPTNLSAALLSGLLVSQPTAGAQQTSAGTAAGTAIINQARAEYVLSDSNQPMVSVSNTVVTTVSAVCSVSVTPNGTVAQPGQTAALMPGDGATFVYRITNTGNTCTFPVSARLESGSTGRGTLRVVVDANNNGQADGNETSISFVELTPDTGATLLLLSGATSGTVYMNLVAGCGNGGRVDDDNVSAAQTSQPAIMTVRKTFSPALIRPGLEATVTVQASNEGQGPSREVVLTDLLDAQLAQGLSFVPGKRPHRCGHAGVHH